VAQKFTVPITVKQLSSAGSDAITVFVDADTYARLKIEAGGRLTWGPGNGVGDVNLYRAAANVLKTDDTFKTPTLFVDEIEIDPTGAQSDHVLKFDGTKFVSASASFGSANSSTISVSSNSPESPTEGNLWFDSETAQTFIYYDSNWVEVGGSTNGAIMQVSSSAPGSPLEGSMWFDSDTAQTFIYYDSQWVEVGASAMAATVSSNAPVSPISGQIWLNADTGGVYVYYSNVWIEVGAVPQLTSAVITTALGYTPSPPLTSAAITTALGYTPAPPLTSATINTALGYTPANSSTAATTGKAIAMSIVFGG